MQLNSTVERTWNLQNIIRVTLVSDRRGWSDHVRGRQLFVGISEYTLITDDLEAQRKSGTTILW